MSLPLLSQAFLADLVSERGLSANTVAAYRADVEAFILFLDKRSIADASAITPEDAVAYVAQMRRAHRKPATIARRLTALRMFSHFLCRESYRTADFTAGVDLGRPRPAGLPATLTPEEIDRLIAAPDRSTASGLRDAAMLELMYGSGLRVSELVSLRVSDVDLLAGLVRPFGKGSKERQTPVGEGVRRAVALYKERVRPELLASREHAPTDSLFVTTRGAPMTRGHFWRLIQQYAASARIAKHVTPHTLRHSFDASSGRRRRRTRHSRDDGPCQRRNDTALHARRCRPSAQDIRPVASAGELTRTPAGSAVDRSICFSLAIFAILIDFSNKCVYNRGASDVSLLTSNS